MNSENPKTPREDLEARLTALLLGELPTDQAAALRAAIDQDAELAKLYQRLQQTIALVRETATSPTEQPTAQPAALKLSGERRQKLLAHFKTVAPKEFAKPARRREPSWLVPMSVAAALVLILGLVAFLPAYRREFAMMNHFAESSESISANKKERLHFGTWSL